MNMKNNKNRILTVIIGFFVFIIPLLFLCITVNREFDFSKERIEEDLKEKILQTVNQLEENLDPFNYLNSEFSEIHSKLFPNCSEEILDKIPDDSYTKSLYSKETLDKLVSLIKDRYSPVIVTLSNQDVKDIYAYFSPKLEEDIEKNSEYKDEKSEFLKNKTYLDSNIINVKYEQNFNKSPKNYVLEMTEEEKRRLGLNKRHYYRLCYKYISRFCAYARSNLLYTDYFNKQILFYILKYTMSSKGIHGYYNCIIPQSHIDPDLILKYALAKQDLNPFTKTEKVINHSGIGMIHISDGFEYILNYPTSFISQVDAYNRLRRIDKSDLLKYNLKVTSNYPKELKYFSILVKITNILSIILPLFYIFFSFNIINKCFNLNIGLTNKLVIILSILLLLPILGIGLLSLIISNNLTEIVNLNMSKSLHNNLESVGLLDKENELRNFTSIVEMKKSISKIDLYKQLKSKPDYLNIFSTNKIPYWYYIFMDYFIIFPENGKGEVFCYNENGDRIFERGQSKRILEMTKIILIKYLKNLGFFKNDNEINNNLLEQIMAIYKKSFIETENVDRKQCRADECFDITIGKTPPRKEPEWFSTNKSDVKWVSISDMGSCGLYISDTSESLTQEAIKKHNVKVVPDNTILLSFKLTVGRVAITDGIMATNEAIAHFNSDKTNINEYLYCYLKNFNYQTMGSTSSIAIAVNSKIIKAMPFIVPTDYELIEFHNKVQPMFGLIKNNLKENKQLSAFRDTLLPKLMSGELDVSDVDI